MATQTLTFAHILGDSTPSAGRTIKAAPTPGQFIDSTTVDTAALVLTGVTDADGLLSLTLLQGIIYTIAIEKWGTKTILVSEDAAKEFVTYLGEDAAVAGAVAGTYKFRDGESVRFFLVQDGDGAYQLGFEVMA